MIGAIPLMFAIDATFEIAGGFIYNQKIFNNIEKDILKRKESDSGNSSSSDSGGYIDYGDSGSGGCSGGGCGGGE